jgi:predicted adenylyl cyclase CyaB
MDARFTCAAGSPPAAPHVHEGGKMPTELEAKLAVESHDPIRARLIGLRATFLSRVLETNSIYDRPDCQLLDGGCGLRLRGIELLDGEPKPASLTFKGPIQPGPFKKREELELDIADAEGMHGLLAAIGFIEVLRFSKRRESWSYGGCRVDLDELPHLGRFVEIEGPDDDAVNSVRNALGLGDANHITDSYVALLASLSPCDATGPVTIVFE